MQADLIKISRQCYSVMIERLSEGAEAVSLVRGASCGGISGNTVYETAKTGGIVGKLAKLIRAAHGARP
jgi:hypothetical protein